MIIILFLGFSFIMSSNGDCIDRRADCKPYKKYCPLAKKYFDYFCQKTCETCSISEPSGTIYNNLSSRNKQRHTAYRVKDKSSLNKSSLTKIKSIAESFVQRGKLIIDNIFGKQPLSASNLTVSIGSQLSSPSPLIKDSLRANISDEISTVTRRPVTSSDEKTITVSVFSINKSSLTYSEPLPSRTFEKTSIAPTTLMAQNSSTKNTPNSYKNRKESVTTTAPKSSLITSVSISTVRSRLCSTMSLADPSCQPSNYLSNDVKYTLRRGPGINSVTNSLSNILRKPAPRNSSKKFEVVPACVDRKKNCILLKDSCKPNEFFKHFCRKTCNLCKKGCHDQWSKCPTFRKYCRSTKQMRNFCPKTCNLCKEDAPPNSNKSTSRLKNRSKSKVAVVVNSNQRLMSGQKLPIKRLIASDPKDRVEHKSSSNHISRGMSMRTSGCTDKRPNCHLFRRFCKRSIEYFNNFCRKTCNLCGKSIMNKSGKSSPPSVQQSVRIIPADKNRRKPSKTKSIMNKTRKTSPPSLRQSVRIIHREKNKRKRRCVDRKKNCHLYRKYCVTSKRYYKQYCAKTCNLCERGSLGRYVITANKSKRTK